MIDMEQTRQTGQTKHLGPSIVPHHMIETLFGPFV